jgi:site-specific DNA recombinase
MMSTQVALYARVSSDQQNEARTIESQLADLRTRLAAEGITLPAELEFVDNGYSGATLIRPALERLRDVAAAGGIDRLYVHCASSAGTQLRPPGALAGRVHPSRR